MIAIIMRVIITELACCRVASPHEYRRRAEDSFCLILESRARRHIALPSLLVSGRWSP